LGFTSELAQPHTYLFTCPKDQKQIQVTLFLDQGAVQHSEPEAPTPTNVALYETGKQIQATSLSVATSFCSAMVGVSAGSVAVYTALLALVLPKSASLLWPTDIWSILPAGGCLVAALLFAMGAYPYLGSMRLSFPASIEHFRQDALMRRANLTLLAFIILALALVGAFLFIIWIAGTPTSIAPAPTATPTITPTP
jgi:nitrate reductase NapE component